MVEDELKNQMSELKEAGIVGQSNITLASNTTSSEEDDDFEEFKGKKIITTKRELKYCRPPYKKGSIEI